ncbi:MAG: biotin transporter BioY [Lachnospiraceae bacterium]
MEKSKTINKLSTRCLVIMSMFAAVLCVSAYISIPLPNGTHITALTMIITIIVLTFPVRQSFSIILVWLLLGIAGVPVFVGGVAGIGYITGPYGGYSIGFLIISIFVPMLCTGRSNRLYLMAVAVLSAIFDDLTGTFWIMAVSKIPFKTAFVTGFVPFIALDIVKALLATQLVPQLRKTINNLDN